MTDELKFATATPRSLR